MAVDAKGKLRTAKKKKHIQPRWCSPMAKGSGDTTNLGGQAHVMYDTCRCHVLGPSTSVQAQFAQESVHGQARIEFIVKGVMYTCISCRVEISHSHGNVATFDLPNAYFRHTTPIYTSQRLFPLHTSEASSLFMYILRFHIPCSSAQKRQHFYNYRTPAKRFSNGL